MQKMLTTSDGMQGNTATGQLNDRLQRTPLRASAEPGY